MTPCTRLLTCPVCAGPLSESATGLRCERGHSFDRAREGYVHLLPAGHGRTGKRGDTMAMLQARQRFLGRGYYRPLAGVLERLTLQHLAPGAGQGPRAIAEIGCGTGDYVAALARNADLVGAAVCFFGVDISKDALRLAARAHPAVCFLVNDATHRLCFADASVDVLLDIFAPRNQIEFSRVLRPDGALLVVVPAEHHLAELRERVPLLAVEPEKAARTALSLSPAFRQVADQRLEYTISVAAEDLPDLLRMTPNAWHLHEPVFEQIGRDGPLVVTAAFHLLCFGRAA